MIVLYSCAGCGLKNTRCEVRTRRPDEDIIAWMEDAVTFTLSVNHRLHSPECRATSMTEVMIPIDGVERIGDEPPKGNE